MSSRHLAPLCALTAVLVLAVAGPISAAGAATGQSGAVETLRRPAAEAAIQSGTSRASSPSACSDRTYNLIGPRWQASYKWSLRIGSTPAGLNRTSVEGAVRKGVGNIVNANNDCGRADRVKATASYLGTTTRKPNCRSRDGRNVVGFKSLPAGTLARACYWWSGNRMVEADVQFNSNEQWATSLTGCRGQVMLEAVTTHEMGHVFGLDHVGERRHGRLTMSTHIDGDCNNQESTLGLGDMLGLEKLYP